MNPSPLHAEKHSSYDPNYFAQLSELEDRHFWFRSRNRVISAVVGQLIQNLAPGYRVLEIGCGTGNVLRSLERTCARGVVVGMEFFWEGLQYARPRTTCSLVRGDIYRPPFRGRFDLVGLFDVLEHLPDDEQILRGLNELLAPKGALVLTVPAHPFLWSDFDEASHHIRRYSQADLESKLVRASFAVEYLTLYMASLFPLMWLKRRFFSRSRRRVPQESTERHRDVVGSELRIVPGLNGLLSFLLAQECRLIARRRRLPLGTSLFAIARKP